MTECSAVASFQFDNLEELRVLSAVIDAGSLSSAAEKLGLPARTVGRRLAALEQRVGQTLIHRSTRSMQPTAAALGLASDCREALGLLERAEDRMAGQRGELAGLVRVSLPSLLASDVVNAVVESRDDHPDLRLEFEVRDGSLRELGSLGLDLALVAQRPERGHDLVRRIGQIRSYLGAAPSYLEAHGQPGAPEDLRNHLCLCFWRQERWTLVKGRKHVEVPVSGRIVSTDSRLLRHALTAGLGIGPVSKVLLETRSDVFQPVLPDWHWPTMNMWLLTAPASAELLRVRFVRDLLVRALVNAPLTSG